MSGDSDKYVRPLELTDDGWVRPAQMELSVSPGASLQRCENVSDRLSIVKSRRDPPISDAERYRQLRTACMNGEITPLELEVSSYRLFGIDRYRVAIIPK